MCEYANYNNEYYDCDNYNTVVSTVSTVDREWYRRRHSRNFMYFSPLCNAPPYAFDCTFCTLVNDTLVNHTHHSPSWHSVTILIHFHIRRSSISPPLLINHQSLLPLSPSLIRYPSSRLCEFTCNFCYLFMFVCYL